jgi:uncharacterized protein (TIGR03067 family)
MNALVGLILASALAVPAPEQKDVPKDVDKLQGVWKVTSATSRGTQMPAALLQAPSLTLVVVGDQYVFSTHAGAFTLDPAKGTVDFDVKAGRYKGKMVPGRYALAGESLKLIMPTSLLNPVRPAEAKPGDEPVGITYTFERDGKATKEQAEALLKDRTTALPDKKGFGVQGAPGAGVPGGGAPGGGAPGGGAPGAGVPGGGAPGAGGFAGGKGGAAGPAATMQMIERILERLERIEQRLDAMEKKLAAPREQK